MLHSMTEASINRPVTLLEDFSLIRLALEGAPECFSALMDRHVVAIKRHIRSMTPNEADAEDLLQDVILKVWRRLSTFRCESSFRTWMTRVAINEVMQSYRKQKRLPIYRAPGDFSSIASPADSPQRSLARIEDVQAVRHAVAELPTKYRLVLVLRDLEEFDVRETARRLRLTVPAVKARLFRARRMLVVALEQRKNSVLEDAA